ncbi:outer dense fiber protein 3-like [Meleagris gallopavo]|uniref:outer dense fiber protein 3-like n=1 Tax=Meleagris gallopavo TaxID=9103 RepID=UPI00093E1B14|nr:outer dense fiber protein 3-like [Meleagris gallopavo]XP_019467529.1 outer dense fiber protein 3-like [Meleagris gallopavo]
MGPNTACTSASPCYSMRGRSQRGRFDEDLAKTPGPAALPKVAVDTYKTRAPAYTMAARPKPAEGKAAKPGPADYSVGRVRQLAA